jgi:hypothetical protein
MRLFSTACDSASIPQILSKWRPFSFTFNRANSKEGLVEDSQVALPDIVADKGRASQ